MIKKWKRLYVEKTLHQKLRLAIMTFSMIPLVCLVCFFFPFIYQTQLGEIKEEVQTENQDRYSNMINEMHIIELMAKSVWSDTDFITEIGKAAIDNSLGEYNRYLFQEQTLSVLRVITSISQVQSARIHLDYPNLREYTNHIYSMDKAKDSLWYQDRDSLPINGAWYMNVTERKTYGTYSTYFMEKNMASFVIPIRVTSALTGVFEIVLPIYSIVPDIYTNMKTQDVFMVDSRERLLGIEEESVFSDITTEDLNDILGISSLQEYSAQGTQIRRGTWKGMPILLSTVKDNKTGIILMQIVSVQKSYQTMIIEIIGVFLLVIIMTAVLLKAINGIVEHLLHDLNIFIEYMGMVEHGSLDVEIPRLQQVEINTVAVEYNRMLGSVKQLMEIGIQREVMVKEAQLKSLEKQINSHFLYNVLDSIKMMAEVKGIYNVSDALLALGRMFRYNLQIGSHSVTLQEEISYLENYLMLCNIRYDYYINLSENIEESIRQLKVPKVILQPIAENSIIHGLDELAEDTTIYLKAYVKEDCAYIEMTDMGKGMNESTLEKVRQGIHDTAESSHLSSGIGLHNIHERIRLMDGDQYGVEIYSKEGCYTKVVLTIRAEGLV